ncbi:MAG: hypothetical protein CVU11_10645 [Bacteroidetes bacterium HGW-Bacteroidetes-6]|nr:MAG: hypothetical protein CVU11_10645 [Bacteroidetes bacterium HGW-Bacteroidetes-6]
MKRIAIILLFLLTALCSGGQKIVIINNQSDSNKISEFVFEGDSIQLSVYLKAELHKLYSEGYLYAHFSEILNWKSDTISIFRFKGNRVVLVKLASGNADEAMLRSIGWKPSSLKKHNTLDPARVLDWENSIVSYYENIGFPFANVAFRIDSLCNDSVSASWQVKTGPLIVFDSIIQKGKYKPNSGFIGTWLNIEKGKPYSENKIQMVRLRLKMSELIEEEKPMSVYFTAGKANLYLYLRRKKANRFDGILGFAPNNDNPGKVVFTGDVNLKLANSFNHGDQISLKWKSSANSSQEVKVKASLPFLFGLPLGISGSLDIYKRDTLYVKTKQRYGITYFSGIASELDFFAENTENRVIDQSIFATATTLPVWADSRTTSAGLGFKVVRTDNIIIPHKGFIIETEITAGKKNLLKNNSAPEELYDGVVLETGLYRGNMSLSLFRPVTKTLHLMISNQSGYLKSKSLFENDLFQIGGLSIMRGFDEKSLPVSMYSVSTIEMRFFLEQLSYLAIFTDYAATQQLQNNNYNYKYYISLGTGMSFSTNAGIFNIFYALGKQNPGEFVIRNGKIHFGYIARF